MVQRLEVPFKDMREVLIQVTSALAEMEENLLTPKPGEGSTVQSRIAGAKQKMLDSKAIEENGDGSK